MRMSSDLVGARVLVTAASRGIGFGAARRFLEEGSRVVINSSNNERLQAALDQLKPLGEVYGILGDLNRKQDLDNLVSESVKLLGGIDTFVYVTGSPKPGVFMEQSYEDWEDASRLMAVSPSYLAKKVADVMIAGGIRGRMVFLSSFAIREPVPNIALSNVCRISIAGLVRTLARELGPKGIRVNGILPGYIRTARIDQIASNTAKKKGISVEQAILEIEKEIPMGHMGKTEMLAKSIVFLGSEMSEYVTGAMLPVDGGILRSVG
jgi:3-oxoacyl-[acyl-carrier protein] reductase